MACSPAVFVCRREKWNRAGSGDGATNRRKLSPQQKKALAYRKDHPLQAENPHAFRHHWPRQRAAINQAYRHRVRQLLGEYRGVPVEERDDSAGARVRSVRRRSKRKWGAVPLRAAIQQRQRRQVYGAARQYFGHPYIAARDHQRFSAYLAALTAGATARQPGLARRFADLLDAARQANPDMTRYRTGTMPSQYPAWLRAFLRDEPAWEPRLRAWIARVLGDED
ncbi:MAG TPA: hypothetical protein VGR57_15700 [Ktedonobacterales bacterium]|nr:hypothetical protein [Ktedonobacterales bacterium]